MQLFDYQRSAIDRLQGKKRVAFYHDMGLGKTFTGAQKLLEETRAYSLVVCQKSKVQDWVDHFNENTPVAAFDATSKAGYSHLLDVVAHPSDYPQNGVLRRLRG